MKKTIFLFCGLVSALLLSSCFPDRPTPLAPPAWIQGVWEDTGSWTFTFTVDNLLWDTGPTIIDYKADDEACEPPGDIIDESSDAAYTIDRVTGTALWQRIRFTKTSDTTMNLTRWSGDTIDPLVTDYPLTKVP